MQRLSVCEYSAGLKCVFISTHVSIRTVGDALPHAAEKTCRTESYCPSSESLVSLVLFVSQRDLVENLRYWLFSAANKRNAVQLFFHAVVDFFALWTPPVCCGDFITTDAARFILSSH